MNEDSARCWTNSSFKDTSRSFIAAVALERKLKAETFLTLANSELILVSKAANCPVNEPGDFSVQRVSYCRLGGQKKGVLVDAGHVG